MVGPGEWLEVRKLTLRGYAEPGGYEAHRPFDAVLQADLFGSRAFLSGMLRRDGADLGRADYRGIARLLRDEFGIVEGVADRHGREVMLQAERWAGRVNV
ncbi:MAG: hypothetical protein C0423_00595 [Methylibium sp.]|nr:hypothetical protein [Methylibium sp.]